MKPIKLLLFVLASFTIADCMGKSGEKVNPSNVEENGSPVTIYYFHGEHRCPTCIAIENQTRVALEINLIREVEAGNVELQVINIDEA